jgi:putative DNA primase/helicase
MELMKDLRLFEEHGVEFTSRNGNELIGTCPFCDKADHFFVDESTGRFKCHRCDAEGNRISFLEKISQHRHEETTTEDFRRLAKQRGIPTKTLRKNRLAWDGELWCIPVRSSSGRVHDIRRWDPSAGRIKSSTGCKVQLFNGHSLVSKEDNARTVYVCEGEWDAMVWESVVGSKGIVVGVPGAGTFKSEWIARFRNRRVILLYDHDDAGRKGMEKSSRKLLPVAESVKSIKWPAKKPGGYDIRDFVRSCRRSDLPNSRIIAKLMKLIIAAEVKATSIQTDRRERDPHLLAEKIIQRHHQIDGNDTILFHNGSWNKWCDSRYRLLPDTEMRAITNHQLRVLLDELALMGSLTQSEILNVLRALEAKCLVPGTVEIPSWLPRVDHPPTSEPLSMTNGLLDVDAAISHKKSVLYPQSPLWFSRTHIEYEYDPDAVCPRWLRFLKQVLPESDKRRLLQEYAGYCLTTDTSFHKFLILEGVGANGKSVVTDVITQMLGRDNVSHVALEQFGERFAMAPTVGKLANIASEIDLGRSIAESVLKEFVSGDRVRVEYKFKTPFEAKPTTKLLFATNRLPKFEDTTEGIWRRLLVIKFDVRIPLGEQDRKLAQKICKKELPGILNWALRGLARLRKNARFTEPTSTLRAIKQHRLDSNPVMRFLEECFRFDPNQNTSCRSAHAKFCEWAENRKIDVVSDADFGREVARVFPDVKRKRMRFGDSRLYVYEGLDLVS